MRGSKATPLTSDVSGFIEDGFSEVSELAEEMRSWADSLEEKFSNTSKYEEVSAAADGLESVEAPEVPDAVAGTPASCTVDTRKGLARRDRLSNAIAKLEAAKDAAENCRSELETEKAELEADGDENPRIEELDDEIDSINTMIEELENAIGELEGVSFPGMYG